MSNDNQKENNKVSIKPFIILFLISIGIFAIIYFFHSKNIENRFNDTLQNYEKSMSAIFNNMAITNGNNENIYTNLFQTNNNIVINNNQLQNNNIENLKLSFEVGFKMLESSMNEIMKNSNDILQFWFAFLSIIMIVFTIIGFFLNNNILDNAKKQLEMVEKEARTSKESIEKETNKLIEESNKKIQENNLFNLGIQSLNNKDYKLAIYYFTEVIKLNPNNYQAYNNRGIAKDKLGELNEAIEDYNKAIELNNNYSEAYNNRGNAKSNLANTKEKNSEEYNKLINEAINDYNEAIKLNPNISETYNNIGAVKYDLANIKEKNSKEYNKLMNEAIDNYSKAIEIYYKNSTAYNNRGLAKLKLEKFEEAIKDFITAYELDNDNEIKEKSRNELISLTRKGYNEAKEFCRKYNINWD